MAPPLRSRWFRRLSWRTGGTSASDEVGAATVKISFPETPLVVAGIVGGPIVMFLLTPLRNALTLASHDATSSAAELYRQTLEAGGWTGGFAPMVMSCPQFCVMGPLYHFLNEFFGMQGPAVVATGIVESMFTYGAQSRNAQMAYNQEKAVAGVAPLQVPLANPLLPSGPGISLHIARNAVTMWGLRIFAEPCEACLRQVVRGFGKTLPDNVFKVLGVFVASLLAAVVSAPLNQAYNFAVTSEAYYFGGPYARVLEILNFFQTSYLVFSDDGSLTGISSTLLRDLSMRAAYAATLSAMFVAVERITVWLWRWRSHCLRVARVRETQYCS